MATIGIQTTFLHAFNNEYSTMRLQDKFWEMLVQLEPTMYQIHITTGPSRELVLHVKLLTALYGLIRSVLLFYTTLHGELKDVGLETNPYVIHLCSYQNDQ